MDGTVWYYMVPYGTIWVPYGFPNSSAVPDFPDDFFLKRASLVIFLTILIFISRNGLRINDEYNKYNYNPLINSNYQFIGGDKDFHFRYNKQFKEFDKKYPRFNFLGKVIYITVLKD